MNVEYLTELHAEVSLVTEDQMKFLKDVVSVVEEKILNGVDLQQNEEKNFKVAKDLEIITKKLSIIVNRLKDGPNAKAKFLENFPKWLKFRKDGIFHLRELAKSMQSNKLKYNRLKYAGYGTSLVGGGLCLASTFAIPIAPLAVGGYMFGAGSFTAFSASVIESFLLKTQIDRAQKIRNEDEIFFQKMSDWVKHSSDLENALAEISEMDIVQDISKDVKELVTKGMNIKTQSDRLIFLEENIRSIVKRPSKKWKMAECAIVVFALVKLFVLLCEPRNRFVFDFAELTVKSFVGIIQLSEDAIHFEKLLLLFKIKAVLSKAVIKGALAGLGIALDAASIALLSIDDNSSRSREAEILLNAAIEMEKEASKFEKVHDNIILSLNEIK